MFEARKLRGVAGQFNKLVGYIYLKTSDSTLLPAIFDENTLPNFESAVETLCEDLKDLAQHIRSYHRKQYWIEDFREYYRDANSSFENLKKLIPKESWLAPIIEGGYNDFYSTYRKVLDILTPPKKEKEEKKSPTAGKELKNIA